MTPDTQAEFNLELLKALDRIAEILQELDSSLMVIADNIERHP